MLANVALGVLVIRQSLVRGAGDASLVHQTLGVGLGPLELGGGLAGPEDREATRLEAVDDPLDERRLRPDDGEVDLTRLGEVGECVDLLGLERDRVRECLCATVAGRCEYICGGLFTLELPDERVFTAS